MTGIDRIAAERQRQLDVEGYDAEHDRGAARALALAAACYATPPDRRYIRRVAPIDWPWDEEDWKPTTAERDLEKAGALIAAALDALSGAEGRPTG